jgi:hypothetical protein
MPARDSQHSLGPLLSEHALRPLGALIALASDASATASLRSQAVGVSDLWTPDETVFAAGWAELVARHPSMRAHALGEPRRAVLSLAKSLLLSRAFDKSGEEADASSAPESTAKPEGWDPERVARHVERAAAQAYQSYRRARLLQLLHDCDVVYREPHSARVRLLQVRGGAIAAASDSTLQHTPSAALRRPRAEPSEFERTKYERLRILITELKRIARDGGDVRVHWSPSRQLPVAFLPGVLRLV